ncbi:MAG TPA: GNAT family N-acetyltransferase [Caulobacteraceae bacterium]|jgi:RimJ/RimL family protein N-acetyltransferase|nr:GNAT family N-acetyltransferase [Caulobacteraceae bacterium]
MIETERLVLRPWIETDRDAFVGMVTDREVGDWLGGARTRDQAMGDFDRMLAFWTERGHGQLAVVRNQDGALVGRVGCRRQPVEWEHPMVGRVEIGWLLARDAWGFGYATEASAAIIPWGFGVFADDEIYAWTAATNHRSEAVMRRIGMSRAAALDFEHPALAAEDPLRSHVVYLARRPIGSSDVR